MTALYLILLVLAALCFLATAFGRTVNDVNLFALGLLFWVLVPLIQSAQVVF